MGFWRRIWDIANTEIQIPWEETAKGSAETGKAVLDLAEKLQKNQDIQALQPYISKIDSLLDALNSPLANVVGATFPFLPLATGVLKFIVTQTRQEPSLQDEVLLVSQTAYLQSMQQFFQDHPEIRQQLQEKPASEATQKKIKQLGTHLVDANGDKIPFEERKDAKDAKEVLICFHESKLAQAYNPILQQRLQESGFDAETASTITERISRNTHRYLKEAVAEVQNEAQQLTKIYGDGWLRDIETYYSIDRYLTEIIQEQPKEKVFDENFTLKDIYVSLNVQPVEEGKVKKDEEPEDIEEWAKRILKDEQKQQQVLFVQAGPGGGKSVFCKMFADRVRQKLHPIWIPILIRLRDVETFKDFWKTLTQAVGWDFASSDGGWLTDRNTRFLFLLDGFDELVLERGDKTDLREFLDQVALFQRRFAQNPEQGHRILITGRPLALFGIERRMPENLERVKINLMNEEIQEQWLEKWQQVVDANSSTAREKTQAFREFLRHERCPESVQTLAREPLLLYLLAAMHRDDSFSRDDFDSEESDRVKVTIYEEALKWVLEKQRTDDNRNVNREITQLETETLQSILAEAGLCVVQSGKERAQIQTIEDRLIAKGEKEAKEYIEEARNASQEVPLKNALATFYLKSADGDSKNENSVEFFHKSFGEFLCAMRLQESLEEWTEQKRRKTYTIKDKEFDWQIYDLLGFGFLTPEIMEYLRGLLKESTLDWEILFKRLNNFYLRWSDGEFIESLEASEHILPLDKARQMQKYRISKGQRQVDVYAGLNVFILLLEINRYAQSREDLKEKISFHPCGKDDDFDNQRLLRMISYCECLGVGNFQVSLVNFLSGVNLSEANLFRANLFRANLFRADLFRANLVRAYLSGADLSEANLLGADLFRANLFRADLFRANLVRAYLPGADLSEANLFRADLFRADLFRADLSEADLSEANLFRANLVRADLSKADLSGADLSEANLLGADLFRADLSEADLSGANLSRANLSEARLSEIQWNNKTEWSNTRGTHRATHVPQALQKDP
jgi:uncharacterized protein YjbI with pentapeptide repeats